MKTATCEAEGWASRCWIRKKGSLFRICESFANCLRWCGRKERFCDEPTHRSRTMSVVLTFPLWGGRGWHHSVPWKNIICWKEKRPKKRHWNARHTCTCHKARAQTHMPDRAGVDARHTPVRVWGVGVFNTGRYRSQFKINLKFNSNSNQIQIKFKSCTL